MREIAGVIPAAGGGVCTVGPVSVEPDIVTAVRAWRKSRSTRTLMPACWHTMLQNAREASERIAVKNEVL